MKYLPFKLMLLVLPLSAQAHHPMGGQTPETAVQGLLSGIGHPIIELDHFLFVVGFAALLAFCSRHVFSQVSLFLGLAIIGTLSRMAVPEIHFFEIGIVATSALVGLFMIVQKLDRTQLLWALATVAGLLHGYAYGEAIVGAEATPVLSYLVGYCLIQAALILGIVFGLKHLAGDRLATIAANYRTAAGSLLIGLALIV
ncbi:HupE/UreJ family protein [Oceanobacter sp. 3_MG-2023]|uniref:HupE/UreJ family protein n=1 Tax=Oceanobacter sp. 3_MG-2023 TaxID=3062622 RepID=UPI002736AC4A|nr:HupE/UreJ family protein [Oceanobacter sp. 3_MG-2023]MDP2506972.1 HupE/UreJ family protein [Oceanobacter sp. 3_MG-2023]